MPTSYTTGVQDGAITTLEEFALNCARAFGALVTMRDAPAGTPIPDAFTPSDYNQKAADAAAVRFDMLSKLTEQECESAAQAAFVATLQAKSRYNAERQQFANRYRAMIVKVERWTPPTPDHAGLREFMIAQLNESLRFDCSELYADDDPDTLSGAQWLAEQIESAKKDVSYHLKEQDEENKRTAGRNAWIKALRESLSPKNSL